MTSDRRDKDKALIFVLKQKEERNRQAKPSFGFTDRIMQQVKISARRKQAKRKARTLTGIISMATAASILLLVMLNHIPQDKEISTKPDISLNVEDKNSQKAENTDNQPSPSPLKPQEPNRLEEIQASKSGGQHPSSTTASCKGKPCPTTNKQSDNHTILTAMVSNPSTAKEDSETLKEDLLQEMDDATNYDADFPSPQNLAADREPEVCIECDFQEMETEMTAMINELETLSEP